MHWFWRSAIAIVAGLVLVDALMWGIGNKVLAISFEWVAYTVLQQPPATPPSIAYRVTGAVMSSLLPLVVAVGVYAHLTKRYGPRLYGETRCRKCGDILRGISEPRCSECGERI